MSTIAMNATPTHTNTIPAPWLSDRDLRLDHLQLNKRAYNCCIEQGCRTIADVESSYEAGLLNAEVLGEGTSEEVASALRTFRQSLDGDGKVNWEAFWKERPLVNHRLALTSQSFASLVPEVRNCQIRILHLKKACSGLEAAGIQTVGQLLDAARAGIAHLKNFGALAHNEVVQALTALPYAVEPEGTVDWIRFAKHRQFLVIPEDETESLSAETLLKRLPDICQAIVPQQFDERAWRIFQQRWLASDTTRPTLESIGAIYNLTRERIRQIEEETVKAISKPIFEDDYFGLSFRLRKELGTCFLRAREHFQSLDLSAWRASRWRNELVQLWNIQDRELQRHERLVMALLGFEERRLDHGRLEPLVFDSNTPDKEKRRVMDLVHAIHDVLAANNPGLDSFGLAVLLKKTTEDFADLDEIPTLIELCSTVESIGGDQYRLRFEGLKGRAEQAYRVLCEQGKPIHRSELLREINRRLSADDRLAAESNLVNQISPDPRMEPIGKTGQWALSEWGHETRPLIELIEDVMTKANVAMDQEGIAAEVLKSRAGSENSVRLLLNLNPEKFRKIGPGLYGLASWKESAYEGPIWDLFSVGQFISRFFASRKTQSVAFKELRSAFSEESGLGERSAGGVLFHHPAITVEDVDYKTRLARFNPAWESMPPKKRTSGRALQSDRILAIVRRILLGSPGGEASLIDVVKQAETELKIQRANVYAAISQSEDIETIAVERSAFKICRLRGRHSANFPQIDQLQSLNWKAECQRALTKLTVEDVDIGLFLLGRQYDQAMRSLLEAARDHGSLPVTEGNLKTLQTRIDWAISHLVFVDKSTLNLLRTERNERGHQPPTPEERAAVMKVAPYLAGLYLDFLLMIESRITQFKATAHSSRSNMPSS